MKHYKLQKFALFKDYKTPNSKNSKLPKRTEMAMAEGKGSCVEN
jgi:hypothetical protein